jgi:hypothetical protein
MRVRVVTWNVNHGTTEKQLEDDLRKVRREGREPDVYLLQEFKPAKGHAQVFQEAGLNFVLYEPEFAIAWWSEETHLVKRVRWEGENAYWAMPRALLATLRFNNGQRVRFMTYHPPAHVQRRDWKRWPNIRAALRETDRMWDRKAARALSAGLPFIAGGDDNVDEFKGLTKPFAFMLRGAARQVRSLLPTHHDRRIDDFRVNQLVRVVRGSKRTIRGLTSDHHAFVCDFEIKEAHTR